MAADLSFNFKPVYQKYYRYAHVCQKATALGYCWPPVTRLSACVTPYKNNGTDNDFEVRAGDHQRCHASTLAWTQRAPLGTLVAAIAHCCASTTEVCEDLGFVHPNGPTEYGPESTAARPQVEVDKEVAAHGVTIVELAKQGSAYDINPDSRYNRRVTATTVFDIQGPARGSAMMATAFSPSGEQTRGTLNNCGHGYTPWGTYLSGEENWAGYFHRREDDAVRTAKEVTAFDRYGIKSETSGRYNWSRFGAAGNTDLYSRWSVNKVAASADQDFRNAANTFGWVVEIDPFKPNATPKKRTGLGRMAHEGCWTAKVTPGEPLVLYTGDDARNEYIYKFVSDAKWDPKDATGGLAAGNKYLDAGTLYAAKFNDDGTGEWLPLTMRNPAIVNYADYAFADDVDVLINARLAADAAGATKMDRPEWGGVNPTNGEVYFTLTNSVSGSSGRGTQTPLDAANPRFYADAKGDKISQGNVNGHIIRWREAGNMPAAKVFEWDVYLFGAKADADASVNLSGLTGENDFSSPDGLWFSEATPGLLWIQTDDGYYTDVTNCMMLAALPGAVGDGEAKMVTNQAVPVNGDSDQTVQTYAGKTASPTLLSRFLVGPRDCEITGITESPDGKAVFCEYPTPR